MRFRGRLIAPRCRWLTVVCGITLLALATAAWAQSPIVPDSDVSLKAIPVGQSTRQLIEADWIDADRRYAEVNVPGVSPAAVTSGKINEYGVTTAQDAAGGCDGVKNGRWGFHTASGESEPWWQVDLGGDVRLDRVVIFNRCDGGTPARTKGIRVLVSKGADCENFEVAYEHDGTVFQGVKEKNPLVVGLKDKNVTARIVRLHIPGRCSFALDEIEVYAADKPELNIALGKPADQKSVSKYSYPGTLPDGVMSAKPPSSTTTPDGGFQLAHTREVLDRGKQLAARLAPRTAKARLAPLSEELAKLDARLAKLEAADEVPKDVRREIYLQSRSIVRKIALANPLLKMDKMLFVKRHDPGGIFHMCDQYYGCNGTPGGGLYVLSDPFGPEPKVTNLLENSVVENGRMKGRKLEGGTFLSPELSYDAKTILFAYSECQGTEPYQWGPTVSYHIFKVNADGTGLVQLTDGATDDFDPCFLPNGRIVFVSERRGGYLRCGRHCPVYTMFTMEPDGSDVICISYHETHEWHPSVNNDGMIVYSRWDYVDRDTNVAHHIWTCYPDGRDPRSFHGNYPIKRESRPWMEMSTRSIPNSNKYVFSTGAHHGHAFGSLLLLNPRIEDDRAMSQLTRLTPEVVFPEAESPKSQIKDYMIYGTPWPLDEDDHLCVYDHKVSNRGIYWIDRFGNKELIYRDPEISCISPIPFRARPMPPVIPSATTQAARDRKNPEDVNRPATVAVMNVYDSDFEWPQGTRIEALRIMQVLAKATAPPNSPRIGIANQTNARAVLGTVPVEKDGSAYFEVPPGKEIYFQAVDAKGMAVQSMRSGTYLHPGERMQCQGCHERKHRPPSQPVQTPLALRRAPSRIAPEVSGSNPFNYVRLVQPVLDRNCVECHVENKALDLSGKLDANYGWSRSYANLAAEYGFYFHVTNGSINTGIHGGSRTIPGAFGAKAAKLMEYTDSRHYDVKLSDEDRHRLILWLDSNSEFYGSYENIEAQARGEIVLPSLE